MHIYSLSVGSSDKLLASWFDEDEVIGEIPRMCHFRYGFISFTLHEAAQNLLSECAVRELHRHHSDINLIERNRLQHLKFHPLHVQTEVIHLSSGNIDIKNKTTLMCIWHHFFKSMQILT